MKLLRDNIRSAEMPITPLLRNHVRAKHQRKSKRGVNDALRNR